MMLYLQELGGTGFVINSGLSDNWWGAAFNPDDNTETPWGVGTFTFTSCGAGNIALHL